MAKPQSPPFASKNKAQPVSSAKTWHDRYSLAVRTQEKQFQKFAYWYDLMYAHVNTAQYALWRSKVFIPIIPSKAWAMIAKMTSLNPGFEVGLYGEGLLDPDAEERAEKAQWKLEHDWDNPYFDEPMPEKLFSPLVDATVTGTGIAKIPWCFTNNARYEKWVDESTGEIDITKDVRIESGTGYNELIPHDILSTFIAPGSKSIYSAPWVILEDWVTYDQLKAENDAAGIDLYKNLDQVKELKAEVDRFAAEKRKRQMLTNNEDPIQADQTVRQFKRLECYEKVGNQINLYTYAVGDNGSGEDDFIELANRQLPYWHGKYPLAAFYVKRRPHNFWGQGVFEDTERMQSAFSDVFNHYMDNLNLSLDGMIMKPEGEEFTYVVEPGGEFLYKSAKPEQFKFPEPNPSQFNVVMNFIESQVEEATISRYATGTPNSAVDKTTGTASGIQKLTEMAGDKIGFMKQSFANSLREVGRQWLSNNQQFLDSPFTLMGKQDNRPAPVTINPKDLQGQFVLRINDASMEPISKEQELAKFTAYLQQTVQLQQASVQQAMLTKWATPPIFYDFAGLFEDLSQRTGYANFDKVLMKSDEVLQKIGQNPSNAYLTPNQKITYSIDDLYGSEAGQLLSRDGIQPDPQRQTQVPTPAQANPIDRGETVDPNKAAEVQGQQQLEAQRLQLQAQDQQHQQALDAANLGLKAHDQVFNQAHQAAQFEHMKSQPQQKPKAGVK